MAELLKKLLQPKYNNYIVDNFQPAYKSGHSCETSLLRVYNDIVTTIGRGNGAMLVLLYYVMILK